MTAAWVLLTALPPTQGHLNLIRFAATLRHDGAPVEVKVLVCTQPDEPFCDERVLAVEAAIDVDLRARVQVLHHPHAVQQVPRDAEDTEFWAMWTRILRERGLTDGDLLVASERYGIELARHSGTRFVPYDFDRTVLRCDATSVREDPLAHFGSMLGTFSRLLTRRVTFFGAESTGKTTLSAAVADAVDGYLLPEWARPYLEAVGPEVTDAAMHDIWLGQRALQESARWLSPRPFIIQDTDLFSTLGYWEMYDRSNVPPALATDATATRSDLYIVCPSDIPFEPDPLRYGGDERESTDQYWIDLLERFELPYAVLDTAEPAARQAQATQLVLGTFDRDVLRYERVRESASVASVDRRVGTSWNDSSTR